MNFDEMVNKQLQIIGTAKRLSMFLDSLKLSDDEVSLILDTPVKNISKLKSGKIPPNAFVDKLEAMGLSIRYLFKGIGNPYNNKLKHLQISWAKESIQSEIDLKEKELEILKNELKQWEGEND